MHFIDALSFPSPASPEESFSRRLERALRQAEDALLQAKLALAAGDNEAAHAALEAAGEAHSLAQALRQKARTKSAA